MLNKAIALLGVLTLISGLGKAQEHEVEKKIVIKKSSSSSDGGSKTKTYRRVIRNGKVVEESGDPSLLEGIGLPDRVGRLLRKKGGVDVDVDVDSDAKSKSRTRRIVIKDGKTIVDEATEDGRPVRPGKGFDIDVDVELPDEVRRLIRRLGKGEFDIDMGVLGGKPGSMTRRLIIKDGKTIVDETTKDGKKLDLDLGDLGIDIDALKSGEGIKVFRRAMKDLPDSFRKMLREHGGGKMDFDFDFDFDFDTDSSSEKSEKSDKDSSKGRIRRLLRKGGKGELRDRILKEVEEALDATDPLARDLMDRLGRKLPGKLEGRKEKPDVESDIDALRSRIKSLKKELDRIAPKSGSRRLRKRGDG